MNIKEEINTVKDRVVYLMQNDKNCRNSDLYLFAKYLKVFSPYRIVDTRNIKKMIDKNGKLIWSSFDLEDIKKRFAKALKQGLDNIPELKDFPNFRTVVRTRADIQNTFGYLKPVKTVKEGRKKKEDEMSEYYSKMYSDKGA